jgi:hypothetical protein
MSVRMNSRARRCRKLSDLVRRFETRSIRAIAAA